MTKTALILSLLLLLISCGKGGGRTGAETMELAAIEEVMESESAAAALAPAPVLASTFDVRAKLLGFSRNQEEKVHKAIELIKLVVASDEFKNAIYSKTYGGKRTFVDNNGLSNRQIYQKILEASEQMNRLGKNNRMDVELQLYFDNSNVVGYTYPNVARIWMNRKFFDVYDPTQVADNLFHEWLHKIGFTHDFQYSPSRDHSVPYWVGRLVKRLARKYQ
jgi:hypothetical protein